MHITMAAYTLVWGYHKRLVTHISHPIILKISYMSKVVIDVEYESEYVAGALISRYLP